MNKVLIIVYVPKLEETYELYVPINKKVGTIKKIIVNTISEISNQEENEISKMSMYEKETGARIRLDSFVKDSIITNGTKIILI